MKQNQWFVLLVTLIFVTACGSSAARYNNRGNKDFEADEFDDAMNNYTAAQQENPDLAEPYYNAGNTRYRQTDLETATAQLQQALRTADDELAQQAFYNLGNTHFQAEDWPAAIDAYKQALLLNPDDANGVGFTKVAAATATTAATTRPGKPAATRESGRSTKPTATTAAGSTG
jgi:tetratricopeptide (TPR) repeat protein